ncbi:MAG: pyruvate dehydrogenase (acetyl-transferring) E1 component subunit alpha [Mycobacteriales bacterium]
MSVPTLAAGPSTTAPDRVALFRSMVEIRVFEKRVFDLFLQGLVRYSTHLSLGQEAIAVGFGAAMRPDDLTFATYRGHGHTLVRGTDMVPILAEFMGRSTGLNGGKGGSIHLTDVEHGVMGSYAIVGAHLPIANGAALSAQLRGTTQVVVCFFGDGATNIGAFHEALNLAAVWKLPVVFVCENNLYMEYTPIGDVTAVPRPAADRAAAYGLPAVVVDGNDVDLMYDAASTAIETARSGAGPVLIEALTYRHFGHSRGDPAMYREQAEVDSWLLRDPVDTYRARLLAEGVSSEEELAAIERAALERVDAATEAAKAGPHPTEGALLSQLWADGGSSWRR